MVSWKRELKSLWREARPVRWMRTSRSSIKKWRKLLRLLLRVCLENFHIIRNISDSSQTIVILPIQ